MRPLSGCQPLPHRRRKPYLRPSPPSPPGLRRQAPPPPVTPIRRAAGSSCRTVCLRPGTAHPFDAAVEEGGPGMGGCPVLEECKIGVTDLPAWFGACSLKSDGG